MFDKKLHTPEGVKDFLPKECMLYDTIEESIKSLFTSYGYEPVKSPVFEHYEVFENKGSIKSENMYKFLDRNGSALALRPDMTPAISRIAATSYDKEDIPLRFYYIEDLFRHNKDYQGKDSEFTQAGIELIGDNSLSSDAEAIALSIKSLIISGLKHFKIEIGQVDFFSSIIKEAGIENSKIQKYIINNDFVGFENAVNDLDISDEYKDIILKIPFLRGDYSILKEARRLTSNKKAVESIEKLEKLYEKIKSYGYEEFIFFDLGMIGNLDYYTGIIFKGYSYGTGSPIISGGRYDNLSKNFGANYPSVGFAISINELVSSMKYQKVNLLEKVDKTLISYNEKGEKIALQTADTLRKQGLVVENSFISEDIEAKIQYAKSKEIGGILYFVDEENVVIVNVEDNTRQNVKITDLINEVE